MSSTVWAVRPAHIWSRETHIFRFLRDAPCEVRVVEVRLFRTSRLSEVAAVIQDHCSPLIFAICQHSV